MQLPVYMDNNATTPCDDRVLEAMLPYFSQKFGNASSRIHSFGRQAEDAVARAREQVARLIHADPSEIVFTSGATEAINLAIKGAFEAYASKGNHIITCVTEHNAALDTCRHIEKLGGAVTYLPVQADGFIDQQQLEQAITAETILIAIMYGNNETGVVQPIREIGVIAHKHGVLFFTDATQAVGKIPVDVVADNIDMMAFSGHKIYGPKGVGALYVRRKDPRVKLVAQSNGGGQEQGLRSGTLNVPGIVGLGMASELCMNEMESEGIRLGYLRKKLEEGLLTLGDVEINGMAVKRLTNVTNVHFGNVQGGMLMTDCNNEIAVSAGSACASGSLKPSHVLIAMGLDEAEAKSSVRFSLGRFSTEEEVDFCIDVVRKAVLKQRELLILGEK